MMNNIKQYIQEKLIINKNNKLPFHANDGELEELAYGMFKKYNGSYSYNEISNWVNHLVPNPDEYLEFIEDILEYCNEENIKISKELKYNLEHYEDLDNDETEEINLQILRGMKKLYDEIF